MNDTGQFLLELLLYCNCRLEAGHYHKDLNNPANQQEKESVVLMRNVDASGTKRLLFAIKRPSLAGPSLKTARPQFAPFVLL